MSTKEKVTNKTAEETVNSVSEAAVQPDRPAEETVQEKPKAEGTEEAAAEPEPDKDSFCTVQLCRVAFCSSLNLRKSPGMSAPVIRVLPAGTELQIEPLEWAADGTGVWYPATVDGVTGFVSGQYLTPMEG